MGIQRGIWLDNPYASDLEYFSYPYIYSGANASLARNQVVL